jgi:hypothetical protein
VEYAKDSGEQCHGGGYRMGEDGRSVQIRRNSGKGRPEEVAVFRG